MKTWQKFAPWLIVWGIATWLLFDWLRAHEQPQGQPETPLLVGSGVVAAVMTVVAAYGVHSKSKSRSRAGA